MRPTRRSVRGLLAVGLLVLPAYSASDRWLVWSTSHAVPFLTTATRWHRAFQKLASASVGPKIAIIPAPKGTGVAVRGSLASVVPMSLNAVAPKAIVTVQAGQTLWSIAEAHGVTVETLQAANGLAKSRPIEVGQQIVIPGHSSAAIALPATAVAAAAQPPARRPLSVVVGDGETLWDIAQTYGVSVDAIVEANALPNGDMIRPGQKLVMPYAATEVPARVALSNRLRSVVSIATTFVWPARGRITSGFGFRTHPVFGTREMHTGIDIGAPLGAPVVSAREGKVIWAGWYGGYGLFVRVDHGSGLITAYSHLSKISVKVGQILHPGDLIGRVGSTGFSTGPHLLFEIRIHGRPLDPLKYL
ncbi:MAG TPA: M23 family metallopeptidase [bacterium]|nr:M23 family metallopeptidase [bacterium]